MAKISADDFKTILRDALKDLQGIKDEALNALVNTYGPRLEAIGDSDDPQGEYDDIMTNAHLAGDILEAEAETVPFVAAGKAIQVAAGIALKFALV